MADYSNDARCPIKKIVNFSLVSLMKWLISRGWGELSPMGGGADSGVGNSAEGLEIPGYNPSVYLSIPARHALYCNQDKE